MGSHHIEAGTFRSAAGDRCYVCWTIFRDCSEEERKQADVFRTFYEVRPTIEDQYDLDFTVEILTGRAPLPQRHVIGCIGTFRILPKGGPEGSVRFALEEFYNNGVLPLYVTMSHCWGTRTAMPAKLLRKTVKDFKNGLPISSLPRKFRDAVEIAKWMKVEYLWVDALCIIQDDMEDWLLQSSNMGDIYAGSFCNIAATSSDPDKGCFTERLISIVEPHSMSDPRSQTESDSHVIGYDDFWCNSLLDTTLHTRAWALQERLLSPRTIYFGQEQMFWECRCEMACEAYPKGIPKPFRNQRMRSWRQSDQVLDPANRKPQQVSLLKRVQGWIWPRNSVSNERPPHWAYNIWSRTIERYMECDLTFDRDKLVAISGIAQKVAQVTGESYLAGHWDNPLLAQSLLWYVPSRRQANSKPSVRPSAEGVSSYRAPSWSWASVDAQVTWNWPAEYGETLINIIETTVEETGNVQFGAISGARMEIEGRVSPIEIGIVSRDNDDLVVENGRYALRLRKGSSESINPEPSSTGAPAAEPKVYLDVPMLPRAVMNAYLLPICTEWRGGSDHTAANLAGLLLKKADPAVSEGQYERIGVFALDKLQTQTLLAEETKRETITLL
ncbi:hypothetical protein LTR96_008851 [Exophiala xenobiotica]|nr:hypothetical protein LTR96_008851 [Exophiala xenobiotica]KAK5543234.1 hypothetical protein LTR23_004997 [Chaetothyriales sp. CCFEE 6169]KAK5339015.1 hypothetical protein LTR98_005415 [Exophiala xenobiotica]KAK5380400.1 hypothetical protein LTS13_003257 [Exophiala xenobiotica]KAK5393068.1 hypothetical protein LTR79_009381 [Exophiala xenobiotica]